MHASTRILRDTLGKYYSMRKQRSQELGWNLDQPFATTPHSSAMTYFVLQQTLDPFNPPEAVVAEIPPKWPVIQEVFPFLG